MNGRVTGAHSDQHRCSAPRTERTSDHRGLASLRASDREAAVSRSAETQGIPAGKLIHPVRLGLTGVTVGAPLFDVLALLGKDVSLRRLRNFVEKIGSAVV